MKVLVVTNSYPDLPGSYRGIFIRKLCLALQQKGIAVQVLTPRVFSNSPFREVDSGIKVNRFWYPSHNRPLNQFTRAPIFAMIWFLLAGLIKTIELVIKEKPDVIHGNWIVPTGLIAALAGRLTGTPVINSARGMDVRIRNNRLVRPLFDIALKASTILTVVSPAMKSVKGLEKAEIISSGIDEVFFEIPIEKKPPRIIYTRSLEPVYDPQTFIRSIPLVVKHRPDAHFFMAGTGSLAEDLKALAENLGITDNVSFPGRISTQEVADLMKEAMIFVSTAIEDGTSIALLEAMAAGVTPVATDIEANRAWVNHGIDGYLFMPKDSNDLANKIIQAISGEISPTVFQEKRAMLKEIISWEIIASRFIDIYSNVTVKSGNMAG